MSEIRCIYRGSAPDFPATDQHPDAVRYGPRVVDGLTLFVDAIGGEPTDNEIRAVLNPPEASTPEERIEATGISVDDLKTVLGLP